MTDLTRQERKDVLRLVLCGLLVLTPILLYVVWISLLTSCGFGNGFDRGAIYTLKEIHVAQQRFRKEDWDRDGIPDYASLDELGRLQRLEVKFIGDSHAREGYLFEVWRSSAPGHPWWGKASPAVLGTTGDRFFYVNRKGAIYFSYVDLPLPLRPEELGDEVALLGS